MAILVGSVNRRRCVIIHLKTYSCWELTLATDSNSSESSIDRSSSGDWTPTLETRQKWYKHLPNKITVRKVIFQNA